MRRRREDALVRAGVMVLFVTVLIAEKFVGDVISSKRRAVKKTKSRKELWMKAELAVRATMNTVWAIGVTAAPILLPGP